jgi:hypothetical protein
LEKKEKGIFKGKTQGYMDELGLEIIMTTVPSNGNKNVC